MNTLQELIISTDAYELCKNIYNIQNLSFLSRKINVLQNLHFIINFFSHNSFQLNY